MKQKLKKNVRSFLSIGSSRYVAQFLAHLEHSGYAILRGEKKISQNFPLRDQTLQWESL